MIFCAFVIAITISESLRLGTMVMLFFWIVVWGSETLPLTNKRESVEMEKRCKICCSKIVRCGSRPERIATIE